MDKELSFIDEMRMQDLARARCAVSGRTVFLDASGRGQAVVSPRIRAEVGLVDGGASAVCLLLGADGRLLARRQVPKGIRGYVFTFDYLRKDGSVLVHHQVGVSAFAGDETRACERVLEEAIA